VDTAGAYPGIGAEERHVAEAIAVNLREMSTLETPIIAVIIGEGGSGGALGIAVADVVLILENAYYSVISPEGCAAILWKDRANAPQAAEALQLTADKLLATGAVDGIVPEPLGGAHLDPPAAANNLKAALIEHLDRLRPIPSKALLEQRYQKFRRLGVLEELTPATDAVTAH
jgi:acetyl-CoA carboxylase carboxyl transferase subunit alpha